MFRVQTDLVIHINDFEASWYRAYIIIPYLSRYILLVLQADSKTYALVYTTQNAAANSHARRMLVTRFEETNRTLLAQGWKAGSIGPFKDLLQLTTTINTIETKYIGIFLIYSIYFLVVDCPVFIDASDPKLRENLAYHCIVGHLPF